MTNIRLGGNAVARVDNEFGNKALEYSFHNGLGHLMGAVEPDGFLAAAYVYGPFGEILKQGSQSWDHLRRFNGKEADQLSRLNYYGYRYYDPLSLTWTQADPLFRFVPDLAYDQPRLMSLYAFSLNNPVRYMDPDGRRPFSGNVGSSPGIPMDNGGKIPLTGYQGPSAADIANFAGEVAYDMTVGAVVEAGEALGTVAAAAVSGAHSEIAAAAGTQRPRRGSQPRQGSRSHSA